MALADYFQTQCPACKTKLQPRALGKTKPFQSKPVPAGQCPQCKAQLQWVRSWQLALMTGAAATAGFVVLMLLLSFFREQFRLNLGTLLGLFVAAGFLSSKELAVATKPPSQP